MFDKLALVLLQRTIGAPVINALGEGVETALDKISGKEKREIAEGILIKLTEEELEFIKSIRKDTSNTKFEESWLEAKKGSIFGFNQLHRFYKGGLRGVRKDHTKVAKLQAIIDRFPFEPEH